MSEPDQDEPTPPIDPDGAAAGGGAARLDPDLGRVLDAAALKALAHPLRFQLIELLIEHGPSTASELGRRVEESSGLTSYHLRELAKHGLIEEAPDIGTARDRYWRSARGGYTLEGFDMLQREDTRDDARFLLDEVVRQRFERLRHWHEAGPRWGREWVEATAEMTARLRLTRDELAELTSDLFAVIDRYREEQVGQLDPTNPREGTVPVVIQLDAFPLGDPPDEGSSEGARSGDHS